MPLLGERTVEERSGESTFPLPSMLGWATFLVALESLQSELRVAIAELTSLFVPEVPEDCLCSTFSGLLGLKTLKYAPLEQLSQVCHQLSSSLS